ncbi:hypothetical protein DXG01_000362 [Tephrocybe rancida]|nr:hypothetical protein DXG01_000362 [Tephrocybe rancida]
MLGQERWVQLQFTWSAKTFTLDIADSDRVFDLKAAIHTLTRVPPERQKILGLVKGKLPPNQGRISDLRLAPGKKFTLVGTPEGDEIKDPSQLENLPDVVNDLDVDFSDNAAASAVYKNDQRNIRKVKEATEKLNVNIIHPLRQGKKLLVLDIDYIYHLFYFDASNIGYQASDVRKFTALRTSWIWLETKLVELGMIGSNHNYQSRNFALNPKEGLKIQAFKNAHTPEAMADRELNKLARYLLHIHLVDFKTLHHKHWKQVVRSLPEQ